MSQQAPDPKSFPIFASVTVGEVQMMLEETLSNVLWDEGLEHLPSISASLASIAESLAVIARTLLPGETLIEVPDPQNPQGFIQVNAITPSNRGAQTGKIDL